MLTLRALALCDNQSIAGLQIYRADEPVLTNKKHKLLEGFVKMFSSSNQLKQSIVTIHII